MTILYHFPSAICAQKVRIALAEKNVTWESRDCAGPALRDPDYLKLNPNGVVPTLIDDGVAIIESRIISEYINEQFEGPPLMPSSPRERHKARLWSKQVDDSLHLNIFILTFLSLIRDQFAKMPGDVRAASMPGLRDPVKRQISEDLMAQGWNSTWGAMAVARMQRLVEDLDEQLSQADFLAGSTYSLADADLTPYILRLRLIGFDDLLNGRPSLEDWWERMQSRPSYAGAIVKWDNPQDEENYRTARERYADQQRALIAGLSK